MKIAFVTQPGHSVRPATGSLEIWTAEVARRLAGSHDVTIFASETPGAVDADHDGIAYRYVSHAGERPLRRVARPAWRLRPGEKPFFASTLYPLAYWIRAGLEIRRGGFEVAHVFNYSQALPILRRLAPGTRLVLHMQCEWLTQLDERMIARRLRHAAAILTCSRALTTRVRKRFPMVADRCHTVPNGTDLEALDIQRELAGEPTRLLFVGRLSPEKGVHVLVDAFTALQAERPELELTLVGEETGAPPEMLVRLADDERVRTLEAFYGGSYVEALRARLSPAAAGRVRFVGAVPYERIADFYRDADIFVMPSLMEAFGMPLAEALAAGIPAVGGRTGGIVDIVEDGVTGLLVEPGDADDLTHALRRLLEDRGLRASLAATGRVKARAQFGWDSVAASTAARFADVLDEPGDRRSDSQAGTAASAA
jgi:glycosyltransferase involved in cell wall biosynthesis